MNPSVLITGGFHFCLLFKTLPGSNPLKSPGQTGVLFIPIRWAVAKDPFRRGRFAPRIRRKHFRFLRLARGSKSFPRNFHPATGPCPLPAERAFRPVAAYERKQVPKTQPPGGCIRPKNRRCWGSTSPAGYRHKRRLMSQQTAIRYFSS